MRFVGSVRKEIGIRTIFNVLGPLANPAGASMQLLGVYSEALVEPLARVLYNLGVKSAMVVYGQDGMDEISLSAPTTVCEVRNGNFKSYIITPEQFGFTRCKKEDLAGGDPKENAQFALDILNGAKGPMRYCSMPELRSTQQEKESQLKRAFRSQERRLRAVAQQSS